MKCKKTCQISLALGSTLSADPSQGSSTSHLKHQSNPPFAVSLVTVLLAPSSAPPAEREQDVHQDLICCLRS